MFIRDNMHASVVTVTPDDSLATALRLTREHRIRHLPVVLSNGELAGILSDRDIRLAMPSPLTTADPDRAEFLERTPIGTVMTRNVIAIGADETIEDAAVLLYRHRIGALPVIDAKNRVRGILSETDILRAFVRLLGVAEPSSRIEVKLPDRPGTLGRVLTAIGESGLNVVSLLVLPSEEEDGMKVAVIHLGTIDPRAAIGILEAAGHEVGWPSLSRDLRKLAGDPS